MAREWLLRGVDPDELKPTPKDEGPKTPRSWWENFWYHHKLAFCLGLFATVALVILVVQLFQKDDPDYRLLLMSEKPYTTGELAALESLLAPYGEDLDGDGKVEVRVENCLYGPHVDQSANSGIQTVQAHLVAADRMFFIMEPDTYKYFTRTLQNTSDDGEVTFFAPIDGDAVVWDWARDPRPIEELKERAPSLYFGVRATKGTAGKATALYEQSRKLLENFIADQKTAQ